MSDKKKALSRLSLAKCLVESKEYSTQKEALEAVNAVFNCIELNLKGENKIALIGFGNFEVKHRAERQGRNLQTGEPMTIKAHKVVSFKAGKTLKDAVNQ